MRRRGNLWAILAILVVVSSVSPALAQKKGKPGIFPETWTNAEKVQMSFEVVDFSRKALAQPWYFTTLQAGIWLGEGLVNAENQEFSSPGAAGAHQPCLFEILFETLFPGFGNPAEPILLSQYPEDPNERMEQLLSESENLREIKNEMRCFWENEQPSHMTYERIHGGIEPCEPTSAAPGADRLAQLEARIAQLETQVADLQKRNQSRKPRFRAARFDKELSSPIKYERIYGDLGP
jgi:hypothetical protein